LSPSFRFFSSLFLSFFRPVSGLFCVLANCSCGLSPTSPLQFGTSRGANVSRRDPSCSFQGDLLV
jgi:hypothetical protein